LRRFTFVDESPGDSTFDTVFQTVAGDTLILRVYLQGNNNTMPTFSLAGVRARHPWLDDRMKVTGYTPIQSERQWKDANILLGPAVHAVVQEFQIHPPEVIDIIDLNLLNIQSKHKNNNNASISHRQSSSQQQNDAPPDYYATVLDNGKSTIPQQLPAAILDLLPKDLPQQFPQLEEMDRDELDALMNDELEFQAFINKLPVMRQLSTVACTILDDNAATAEQHLEQDKPELDRLWQECEALQDTLQCTVGEFEKLEVQQDKLCKPPDSRKMIRDLQKLKKEAFDKSERLADEWLENDASNVDAFLQVFITERKLHHLRACKLELLELNPTR
jgi:hypothetical protein